MHQHFFVNLGSCIWDVVALAVLAVMVGLLIVHIWQRKKRLAELEQELAEKKAIEVTRLKEKDIKSVKKHLQA